MGLPEVWSRLTKSVCTQCLFLSLHVVRSPLWHLQEHLQLGIFFIFCMCMIYLFRIINLGIVGLERSCSDGEMGHGKVDGGDRYWWKREMTLTMGFSCLKRSVQTLSIFEDWWVVFRIMSYVSIAWLAERKSDITAGTSGVYLKKSTD